MAIKQAPESNGAANDAVANRAEKEDLPAHGDLGNSGILEEASPATNSLVRRLGILELGWHAHERAMPAKLLNRIKAGEAIEVPGIIPALAQACRQDPSSKTAHLCHSSVHYITKIEGEGSFCGYRNIQMLISYIIGSRVQGCEVFTSGIPTILQLQDLIERSWDRGINTEGRLETGGIRGTRKHIGTPEAQALFKGLEIPCNVRSFRSSSGGPNAWSQLLSFVRTYFMTGSSMLAEATVHMSDLPPIYLQRPRHSLTIVGIEVHADGKTNLLVLDPGRRPSSQMLCAVKAVEDGKTFNKKFSLSPFRRGKWQLGLFKEFETLTLASST